MPNNLTDAEIKKDLECYRGQKLFAFNGKKPEIYIHDIIDLINRLEGENESLKAEVERLKANEEMAEGYADALVEYTKAEAYKEFANELKCRTHEISYNTMQVVNKDDIDNLLNELVGDGDGK